MAYTNPVFMDENTYFINPFDRGTCANVREFFSPMLRICKTARMNYHNVQSDIAIDRYYRQKAKSKESGKPRGESEYAKVDTSVDMNNTEEGEEQKVGEEQEDEENKEQQLEKLEL